MGEEPLSKEKLMRAIIIAIKTWDDHGKYLPLKKETSDKKNEFKKWFDKFVTQWQVARTLSGKFTDKKRTIINPKRTELEAYLIDYIKIIHNKPQPCQVHDLSQYIAKMKWSSTKKGKAEHNQVISFASKFAFFINPEVFAPYDRFCVAGLKKLDKETKPKNIIIYSSYVNYMKSFDGYYYKYSKQIKNACEQLHIAKLIDDLGLEKTLNDTAAFQRKVFDNILMGLGKRSGY